MYPFVPSNHRTTMRPAQGDQETGRVVIGDERPRWCEGHQNGQLMARDPPACALDGRALYPPRLLVYMDAVARHSCRSFCIPVNNPSHYPSSFASLC